MKKLYSQSIIGLALLVFIFITGCSTGQKSETEYNDHRIVLKLGDDSLTVADIDKRFELDKFTTHDELRQRKIDYVNETLTDWLFINYAKERGITYNIDSSTYYGYLLKRLYQNEIYDHVIMDDSEIRSMYDKYGGEIQFGLIIVTDSTLADSLYGLLIDGENFSEFAAEYSIHSTTSKRGGATRFVKFGSFGDEVQIPAYDLEYGEYTKPFKTFYGWNIVTKFDHIKKSREDLESLWRNYHGIFLNHKNRGAKRKYLDNLLVEYKYKIVDEVLSMMISKADSIRKLENQPRDLPTAGYLNRSAFTEEELQYFVAESDAGGVTVDDFLNITEKYDPYKAPEISQPKIANFMFEELSQRMILLDAINKLGIDSTRDFINDLKYYERKYQVSWMKNELAKDKPEINEDAIQRYYDEHKGEFISPEQVAVMGICLDSRRDADEIYLKLKKGANFKALAKKYSIDKWTGSKNGSLGFITDKSYPELFDVAVKMNEEEISDPVEMYGNYWIIMMKIYRPQSQKAIDLVRSEITNKIENKYRKTKINNWVEEQKKSVEYFINLEILNPEA